MHVVVIKRKIYEANPWVARSLYKACLSSKNIAMENLEHTYALLISLPWLVHHVGYTKKLMGEDWWPYGIEKNRQTIEALCQYSFEQGLSARRMSIEELNKLDGSPIATGPHCFGCTAGSGSSCGGSLV